MKLEAEKPLHGTYSQAPNWTQAWRVILSNKRNILFSEDQWDLAEKWCHFNTTSFYALNPNHHNVDMFGFSFLLLTNKVTQLLWSLFGLGPYYRSVNKLLGFESSVKMVRMYPTHLLTIIDLAGGRSCYLSFFLLIELIEGCLRLRLFAGCRFFGVFEKSRCCGIDLYSKELLGLEIRFVSIRLGDNGSIGGTTSHIPAGALASRPLAWQWLQKNVPWAFRGL